MATPLKLVKPASAFSTRGIAQVIDELIAEIQDLYLSDRVPWVVGYSGGKDSSAVMQLVWMSLSRFRRNQPHEGDPCYFDRHSR